MHQAPRQDEHLGERKQVVKGDFEISPRRVDQGRQESLNYQPGLRDTHPLLPISPPTTSKPNVRVYFTTSYANAVYVSDKFHLLIVPLSLSLYQLFFFFKNQFSSIHCDTLVLHSRSYQARINQIVESPSWGQKAWPSRSHGAKPCDQPSNSIPSQR